MCPDPIFQQGRRKCIKNLVSGNETKSDMPNLKIKIGHYNIYYSKNKGRICAKARNKYPLCEPKQEKYLQEIQANLLENSKAVA